MQTNVSPAPGKAGIFSSLRQAFSGIPLMGWLLGALAAVALEQFLGLQLAHVLGLKKIPVLFGFTIMLKEPISIPGSLAYTSIIYVLPIFIVAKITARAADLASGKLIKLPVVIPALVHLGLLYAVLHIWTEVSDYRLVTLKLMMIMILVTLSLNLINGYMGEFSCSHPGFLAVGAYASSVVTMGLCSDDRLFGAAIITGPFAPLIFPVALFAGGLAAALAALIVAIPSFKTRGDYLAIISLAFLFIVKSFLENMEFLGGPRGMSGQPGWATLPAVFAVVVIGVWVMNNFVTSILGKALNTIRDDESAAEAMTINTRSTKVRAFMFAAFWAGVAGGLYAHLLSYIAPANFSLSMLAEMLAMVYFGGLNSVYGSIVGAVSISMLGEMLRPLQIVKWIVIPLLLILVMIYRPQGLISFKEFNIRKILSPRRGVKQGGDDGAA